MNDKQKHTIESLKAMPLVAHAHGLALTELDAVIAWGEVMEGSEGT